jgi:hypothetical protein
MFVRTVMWDMASSKVTIEELRAYLAAESVQAFSQVPGLVLKQWVADPERNRWGAIYLWESRDVARQQLPSKAREMIGRDPDEVGEFDLEASTTGKSTISDLDRLGRAFES